MPRAQSDEDWYGLKHIKGSNAHETKTMRANMIRYLNVEATCYISEDHLENPMWDYKEQIIRYCWQETSR
jgi:hypothetical protein